MALSIRQVKAIQKKKTTVDFFSLLHIKQSVGQTGTLLLKTLCLYD